jgi:RNA polymerase-interacting CarD/CdnL/TRCF family regulator
MTIFTLFGCPRRGADFAAELEVGQAVVLNAIGVGHVDRRGGNGGEVGSFVTLKWRSERAFVPDSKAKSILRRPVTEAQARAMLKMITQAGSTTVESDVAEWFKTMARLWAQADHPQQADYWGQVLRHADAAPDSRKSVLVLTMGNHHLVEEIAFVLGMEPATVDAEIERRYPWLPELLPPKEM